MFRDQAHQHKKDWLKNNYMFKRSISSAEDGLAKEHLHVQEIMLVSIMLVDWEQHFTYLFTYQHKMVWLKTKTKKLTCSRDQSRQHMMVWLK